MSEGKCAFHFIDSPTMKTATRFLRICVLTILAAAPSFAQVPDTLKQSIPAPERPQRWALLGHSVAVNDSYTVAGAPLDDFGGRDSGVVKVFDSNTGVLLFVLPNPAPAIDDNFGWSVAISGTRVVVGACGDNTGASNAGSAYVYDLSSGTPTVPLVVLNNPSPAANDCFGWSVSMSGTLVAVGALWDDTGASDAGSAYVYDLNSATPMVPLFTLNNPAPASADDFGRSVAISGTRVVVGADGDDTGADSAGSAYVYDLSSATPTVPFATLNNPDPGVYDRFGAAVALSGIRVVVGAYYDDTGAYGAGSAYVYDLSSSTQTVPVATLNNPEPDSDDWFGASVAISGTRVVVGASIDDAGAWGAGSAYVYDLGSATPTVHVATINNPSPGAGDFFGWSVAISGTRLVVGADEDDAGAYGAGSAYVYDLGSATPTVPVAILNDPGLPFEEFFAQSVAVSGALVVVGIPRDDTGLAPNAGSASVYDLSSATPTVPVINLNYRPGAAVEDHLGNSVAISGTRVVIGASDDDRGSSSGGIAADAGSAHVYDLSSAQPHFPVLSLYNPKANTGDYFGWSVAISGTRVVVGAYAKDTGAMDDGSAYVYDLNNSTPTVPVATLNNPTPAVYENFGYAVAVSGTRAVVGAPFADTGGIRAGIVYVYDLGSGTPTVPVITLNNPSPASGDFFGNAVAISGTRVVVGANRDDSGATDTGSAYVYDLSSGTPTVPVAILNNPGPGVGENFGSSVAIDGTTVAIGTPLENTVPNNKGAAYIFGPASNDTDGDGLLDIWEYANFGSVAVRNANDDSDGDGLSELMEQAFNTNPSKPDGPNAIPQVVNEGDSSP